MPRRRAAQQEEIFYPAVRAAGRSREDEKQYFEALEEHHVVDLVLREIESTDPSAEDFLAKVKVLRDLIEHHVEEEEGRTFPRARRRIGVEALEEMGAEMEERRSQLEGSSDFGATDDAFRIAARTRLPE